MKPECCDNCHTSDDPHHCKLFKGQKCDKLKEFIKFIDYTAGIIIIVGTISSAIFDIYQFSRDETVIMLALAYIIINKT